jgi:hypothetical protein
MNDRTIRQVILRKESATRPSSRKMAEKIDRAGAVVIEENILAPGRGDEEAPQEVHRSAEVGSAQSHGKEGGGRQSVRRVSHNDR